MTTEERLEKMERTLATVKNRNKWLWLTLILFAAGILITGAVTTGGDVISAREFRVVDDEGNPRAQLTLTKGEPGLLLVDEKGNPRATLSLTEGNPWLGLADEKGNPRAMLTVAEGGPVLGLHDEEGQTRVMLTLVEGEPMLNLYGEKGRGVWSAP